MTVDEIAKLTGSHEGMLYRALRLLCSHKIFIEVDSRFRLTPMAECLRSDVPWSVRWSCAVQDCLDKASTELYKSIQTGESPFEKATGTSFWSYLMNNPEAGMWFDKEMQAQNVTLNISVLLALNWKQTNIVVDVGGGTGGILMSLLKAHLHLKGILMDQAQVINRAQLTVEEAGLKDRCALAVMDMFREVPSGADTYLLSRVLHDWDDKHATVILEVIRSVMPGKSRLLILEMIVPTDNSRHISKATDVSMLLLFGGGRERTAREFEDLLQAAHFRIVSIQKGRGAADVIEAMPS
jgi:ubiquinone/menaquinone biosynthesis C-methylase UbiE